MKNLKTMFLATTILQFVRKNKCNVLTKEIQVLFLKVSSSIAYFDLEFQRCEQLSGFKITDFRDMRVIKINKTTRGFKGTTVQHVALDNSYEVTAVFFKKQGGEYRNLPYRLPTSPFCTYMNEDTFAIPEVAAASDMVLPLPCPVLPVRFEMHSISFKL